MSCFLDSPGLAMDALPAGVRRRVYEKSIQLRHTDVYSTVRASIMDILTRDADARERLIVIIENEYEVLHHHHTIVRSVTL